MLSPVWFHLGVLVPRNTCHLWQFMTNQTQWGIASVPSVIQSPLELMSRQQTSNCIQPHLILSSTLRLMEEVISSLLVCQHHNVNTLVWHLASSDRNYRTNTPNSTNSASHTARARQHKLLGKSLCCPVWLWRQNGWRPELQEGGAPWDHQWHPGWLVVGPQQADQTGRIHPIQLCGQAQVYRSRAVSPNLFSPLGPGQFNSVKTGKGGMQITTWVYYALARLLPVSVYSMASRVVYLLGEAGNKSLSLTRWGRLKDTRRRVESCWGQRSEIRDTWSPAVHILKLTLSILTLELFVGAPAKAEQTKKAIPSYRTAIKTKREGNYREGYSTNEGNLRVDCVTIAKFRFLNGQFFSLALLSTQPFAGGISAKSSASKPRKSCCCRTMNTGPFSFATRRAVATTSHYRVINMLLLYFLFQ